MRDGIKKFICIHGHFYQPPRENAWLEEIQNQPSAVPFPNWNERINYECYAPNRAARILDDHGKILSIVNNYEKISFNIGPTLMSWLEEHDISTYREIIEADKRSVEANNGHGNALAQVYNHVIMPLASRAEKELQVHWGIKDFERRYGRRPEGMWLSETAVDTETLEILQRAGILFTVLAPRQAEAIRSPDGAWHTVDEATLDTTRAYQVVLPGGGKIAVFFYNGAVSQKVAFNGLLNDGADFARTLIKETENINTQGLVHIATDGESYGHHHRFGEMALASCILNIEKEDDISLTNYGNYLALFPPEAEVRIRENSSWSCYHGVERWRADCGCNTGEHAGWNQQYRKPLRDALDWLRARLTDLYYQEGKVFKDAHQALLDYIEVILNRDETYVKHFLSTHLKDASGGQSMTAALKLLEMMRHASLMYTSCGWFFDEISGLETTQILQYARRAITHAEYFGLYPEEGFRMRLELCPSNLPEYHDGRKVYEEKVIPSEIRLEQVAMHISVLSIFERIPSQLTLYKFFASHVTFKREVHEQNQLVIGHSVMKSVLTWAEFEYSFCVIYLGEIHIVGYLKPGGEKDDFSTFIEHIRVLFRKGALPELINHLHTYFGAEKFGFNNLFQDEKVNLLRIISKQNIKTAVESFRNIYNSNFNILQEMSATGFPISKGYLAIVSFVINADIMDELSVRGNLNFDKLEKMTADLIKWNVGVEDEERLAFLGEKQVFDQIRLYGQNKNNPIHLEQISRLLDWVNRLNLPINLWQSQNEFYEILKSEQGNGKKEQLQIVSDQLQFS